MAYFKVVATKEKRGIYFTLVPYKWEQNNILFWPQHLKFSERELLRADANSCPNIQTWDQFKCILKCSNIPKFQEGIKIEKQLTQCIDTDAEEMFFENMSKTQEVNLIDRNELFEQHFSYPNNINKSQEIIDLNDTQDILILENEKEHGTEDEQQTETDIGIELFEIKEAVTNIKNEISSLKLEMKLQYTKININIDKMYDLLSKCTQNKSVHIDDEKVPTKDLLEKFKFPLTSCEEITKLDEEIRKNAQFKAQLVSDLSKFGGTSGNEDGGKIAYKLIDFLFLSNVLVNYSWTGISRGKSSEKTSFQKLEGILAVFLDVLLLADNRHSKQKNANIFKDGILKHAKKRSLRKRAKLTEHKNVVGDDNNIAEDGEHHLDEVALENDGNDNDDGKNKLDDVAEGTHSE